ncbi:MAG TPA: tetratricopeptide repeat protein [Polyangiaceae bacterium]|nr:tetratricopeptide repeat protein [Polyangiaceae bacterium]
MTALSSFPRRLVAVLAVAGACLGCSRAAEASPALDAANRAFAAGAYGDAATRFQALVEHEGYSAPVLFDLGNAYLRENQPARALLAYERARLLSPRDPAIARNLAQAEAAAGFSDDSSAVMRAARTLTLDEWTWLATAAFWLAVAGTAGAFVSKRGRAWAGRVAVTAGLVAAGAGAALVVASRVNDAGLVLEAAPVLVSPFAGAESSGSLRPGARIAIERTHDAFALVRDRAGHEGWVERAAVAPIVPDGAKYGA